MNEKGISEEFNSKLDKLLEQTENKSENLIFTKDDFTPIEFCISPALYKEEGIILKKFQKIIERHGGTVKFNMGSGGHHFIKLVHNKMASFNSDDDLFLSQFVLDSLEANRLLNLHEYRATKSKFLNVDSNRIMRGLESWEDAKRKRDALEETTTNVVLDSSESEEIMETGECSSYIPRPLKKRKQYYSIEEERGILNYIVKKKYYYRVKGNAIWKDMEKSKVCGYRTWQSMKERYLNHIIPKIGQFKLNPKMEMKVLMPFGRNNVNTSYDTTKETTRQSNVETKQVECVKSDNHESTLEKPSSGIVTKEVHDSKDNEKESGYEQRFLEPLSGVDIGENNILESTINDKNSSKQVVKESTTKKFPDVSPPKSSNNEKAEELISIWDYTEPETSGQPHKTDFSDELTTVKEVQSMPNSSSPNSSHTKEMEELISMWNDTEAETTAKQPQLDSLQDISKSFQVSDTGQDKSCHKETQNSDIGSIQTFEVQNNEEFLGDKRSTQEFDPKIHNCVVNLGRKVQKLDYHHSKPHLSSLKKNKQKSGSVEDRNVSHDEKQDHNSSTETVVFQTSSLLEKSKKRILSENSNDEIPLQINSSYLTSVKQNVAKPSTSSKIESHSSSKNKRPVKESQIDEFFIKKTQKKQKMLENTSSNRLRNHDGKPTKSYATKTSSSSSSSSSSMKKNDSYTSSSDGEYDSAPKSKRVKNYTIDEDEMILDHICIHNLYSSVKGNAMWVDLEKRNYLPGRSWHSLKERFRKRILPRLDKYKMVDEKIIEKFKRYQKAIETETKKHTKYSEDEDALILKYIIKNKRFKEIKGRSMWENMSTWDPLKTRTWESLKNRFLKNIVPNMESYKISDEVVENFTRALKKKRRPPNFKKCQLPRKSRTKRLPTRQYKTLPLDYTSLSDEGTFNNTSVNTNESDCDVPDSYELSSAEDEYENMKKIIKSRKEIKHFTKDSKSNPQQISQNPKKDENVKANNCEESFEQECSENILEKRPIMKRKLFTKGMFGNLYEKTPCYSGCKKDIFNREKRKLPEKIHSQKIDLVGYNHRSPSEDGLNLVNIHSQTDEFVDDQMSQLKTVPNPVNICPPSEGLVDDNQRTPSKEVVNPANISSQSEGIVDVDDNQPSEKVVNPANICSQYERLDDNQRLPSEKVVNPTNISSQSEGLVDSSQRSPSEEAVNPANIHSQYERLDDNQRLPSEKVVSPTNISSQLEGLVDGNQRSPSEKVVNLGNIYSQSEGLVDGNQKSPSEKAANSANIHSQSEGLVDGNQRSPSEKVVNTANICSQSEGLVDGNQRSPSEVVNPANIHSQADRLSEKQRFPSKIIINPANICSQSETLVDSNQKSPLKEVENPANISSQSKRFVDGNQGSPSEEVVNPTNINLQADELNDNQKALTKEAVNPANIHSQSDEVVNNEIVHSREVEVSDNQKSPQNEVKSHSQIDEFVGDFQRSPSKEDLNPANIPSQTDKLCANQKSNSDQTVNLENIPSQTDDLAGVKQKSPSKVSFLITAQNTDNFEEEDISVIESSFISSSGLDVSIEEVQLLYESNPKANSSSQARRLRSQSKHQNLRLLARLKSEKSNILKTKLRRRAIKRET